MAKILIETEIDCGETTCNDCRWVYGEAVGSPYCGWFSIHAIKKPEGTKLGNYGSGRHSLNRLPECLAAQKAAEERE